MKSLPDRHLPFFEGTFVRLDDRPHAPTACLAAIAVRLFSTVSSSSAIALSTLRSRSGSP